MADRKPCKVCNFTRQKSYGVVVPSLEELKVKGERIHILNTTLLGLSLIRITGVVPVH